MKFFIQVVETEIVEAG